MPGHGHNVPGRYSDNGVHSEFEWYVRDVGMTGEDAKVHLVSVLNLDTLAHLDAYITMHGGDEMAPPGDHPGPAVLGPIHLDAGIPKVGQAKRAGQVRGWGGCIYGQWELKLPVC